MPLTKVRPTLHYASDRRCYNGAMCSDLKREWDSRDRIRAQLVAVEPTFSTLYFPMEGKYSGWITHEVDTELYGVVPRHKEITGMHEDVGDALLEAWDKLIGQEDLCH